MKLTAENINTFLQVAVLVKNVGVPAVKEILDHFNNDGEVTIEKIETIGDSMIEPEKIFEE